jgi:hypothetical protein
LEAKAGGSKIKAILGYKVRPCLKKKKREQKNLKKQNKKTFPLTTSARNVNCPLYPLQPFL